MTLFSRILIIALILFSGPATAHDDGSSHGHEGGLGSFALAERDKLVFSVRTTHCAIWYLGRNEMGYELESFLYDSENFERETASDYHLVQPGGTFRTGEVLWLLSTKAGSGIILKAISQP